MSQTEELGSQDTYTYLTYLTLSKFFTDFRKKKITVLDKKVCSTDSNIQDWTRDYYFELGFVRGYFRFR